MNPAPTISVAYDMDEEQHVLMATSHGRTAIVGERIFRSEPWPDVRFKHATAEAAETAAASLRLYLDQWRTGKRREMDEQRKPWWE